MPDESAVDLLQCFELGHNLLGAPQHLHVDLGAIAGEKYVHVPVEGLPYVCVKVRDQFAYVVLRRHYEVDHYNKINFRLFLLFVLSSCQEESLSLSKVLMRNLIYDFFSPKFESGIIFKKVKVF